MRPRHCDKRQGRFRTHELMGEEHPRLLHPAVRLEPQADRTVQGDDRAEAQHLHRIRHQRQQFREHLVHPRLHARIQVKGSHPCRRRPGHRCSGESTKGDAGQERQAVHRYERSGLGRQADHPDAHQGQGHEDHEFYDRRGEIHRLDDRRQAVRFLVG